MARLGDICEIINGYAFKSENYVSSGVRVIRIANVQKGYIEDKSPAFYPINTPNIEKYNLYEDDLLISLTGNVGRVALLKKEFLPAALNQRVACLRVKEGVHYDKLFLYCFLNSDYFENKCIQSAKGVAQKNMSTEWLKEYEVPDFDLEKQRKISEIINRVSHLIDARKQQLSKLDELVKARFVEMFGEVETNVKGFVMKRMDECCKFIGGAQPDKSHFEYEKTNDNIRLIQIRDYKSDRFITYIPKHLARKTCTASDIMIGRYGPPIFQILGGIEGAYNVALMKAIPTDEFNVEYFRCFLKDEKLLRYLESFSQRTAGQDGIQIDKLNAYPCFVPPMELQNEFAAFVEQVNKSRIAVQKALDEAQTLFDSLMQQYFG